MTGVYAAARFLRPPEGVATTFCSNCGNAIPEGAKFCPACGNPSTAPAPTPPSATPPVASKRTYFIWVPIALIALVLIVLAVLSAMPFGGRNRQQEPEVRREPQVIEEPRQTVPSGTVVEIGGPAETVIPQPRTSPPPPVAPPPTPPPAEPPPRVENEAEINEEEAVSVLHSFISKRGGVSADCLVLMSEGYGNVGYTVSARDRCENRSAGRWRVDAKTRQVYRQSSSGRYVRP